MIEKYPSRDDLADVIKDSIPLGTTIDFFKERGICFVTRSREDIADMCGLFYLGLMDYEKLKEFAVKDKTQSAISSLKFHTEANPIELLESARNAPHIDRKKPKILNITRIDDTTTECEIGYVHQKVGRTELLTNIERKFRCQLIIKEDGYDVKVLHEHPEDNREATRLLHDVFKKDKVFKETGNINHIDIGELEISQRTELFDKLLAHQFPNWQLDDVIRITIRAPDDKENIIDADKVRDISRVALQGSNLRSNRYVKELEVDGCYISGMRIKFKDTKDPYLYDFDINFTRSGYPIIKLIHSYVKEDEETNDYTFSREIREKYCSLIYQVLTKYYYNDKEEEEES